MKTIAVIAILFASGAAQAGGFQPWSERTVEASPDAVQAEVPAGSYYRGDVRPDAGADASGQADVVIGPWYARGRV